MTRFRHDPSLPARGVMDNASALPITPPAPQQQGKRTFDALRKADICTQHGHLTKPSRALGVASTLNLTTPHNSACSRAQAGQLPS